MNMGKAIVTKDNFIYKDVTDQMKYGEKARGRIGMV